MGSTHQGPAEHELGEDDLDAMNKTELREHAAAYLAAHEWDAYTEDLCQRIAFGTTLTMGEVKDEVVDDAWAYVTQ